MNNTTNWQQVRDEYLKQLYHKIDEAVGKGVCYSCLDLKTGEIFGDLPVVYEDQLFKVVLPLYPHVQGQLTLIYKPHREDLSFLSPDESSTVMQMCIYLINAMKQGLLAEKVYLLTMCDGPINHLHFTLLPRYPGEIFGVKRFFLEGGPLTNALEISQRIRVELEKIIGYR